MKIKKIFIVMISLIMTFSLVACNDSKTKNDTVIDKKGTYDTKETVKNIKITADEVILSNKVIEGDLQIDVPGLSGDLTLDNVTVNGKIIVNDPQQEYIIRMYDVKAAAMEVNNESNLLKLLASKGTSIPSLSAKGSISLTEQALVGNGFHDVVVSGKSALISLLGAGINQLTVNDSENSTVNIDPETLVMNLVANSPLKIAGKGTVEKLIAKANVDFETAPKNMEIQDGVLVNGTEYSVTTPATTTTTAKVTSATTTKKTTTKPVTTTKSATTVTTKTTTPAVTSPVNTAPIITAADVTIKTGEAFNPLSGVTIYDKEDGGYITVLTSHIQSNTVDLSKTGTYTVVYAYTDKGGLKTTYSRKVTVEQGNKLSAPQNVKVYLDSYGDVVLEWDPVANAGSYDIYFNNFILDNASANTKRFIVRADEITTYRDFDLGVRAISKSKDIKDSDTASASFKYIRDEVDIPTSVYASKEYVDMKFKPSPIGIKDNRTFAIVTVTLDGNRLPNFRVNSKNKTGTNGIAEITYDRSQGLDMSMVFSEVGEYVIKIVIEDSSGARRTESYTIQSRNGGSSGGSTGSVRAENLTFSAHRNWSTGANLEFTLNHDLDLRDGNSDLYVEFEWSVRDGSYGTITRHVDSFLSKTKILAGENIVVNISSAVTGSRAISSQLDSGNTVYIYAVVIVTDKYGSERATKSSNVIFEP